MRASFAHINSTAYEDSPIVRRMRKKGLAMRQKPVPMTGPSNPNVAQQWFIENHHRYVDTATTQSIGWTSTWEPRKEKAFMDNLGNTGPFGHLEQVEEIDALVTFLVNAEWDAFATPKEVGFMPDHWVKGNRQAINVGDPPKRKWFIGHGSVIAYVVGGDGTSVVVVTSRPACPPANVGVQDPENIFSVNRERALVMIQQYRDLLATGFASPEERKRAIGGDK